MNNTKKITTLGIMGALSILLAMLVHFPIFVAAPFLEYDPADIPIFIATFMFGPLSGLILTLVVSIIQGMTVSASSGVIGMLMHFLSTGAFVLVAGNIYKRNHTRKGALISLFAGFAAMVTVMTLWNIVFTPIFMKVPRQAVIELLVPAIIPFNAVKAGGNAAVTFIVYKKISNFVTGKKNNI